MVRKYLRPAALTVERKLLKVLKVVFVFKGLLSPIGLNGFAGIGLL
jgi:hypothetical protein